MNVADICQKDVDSARRGESAAEAAQRMGARMVGTLVVLDDAGTPLGIVTDRDLAVSVLGQRKDPDATTVEDVMTAEPRTVLQTASIEEALAVMREAGVRRLPVVGKGGEIEGVISLDDILAWMVSELSEVGDLLRIRGPRALARS